MRTARLFLKVALVADVRLKLPVGEPGEGRTLQGGTRGTAARCVPLCPALQPGAAGLGRVWSKAPPPALLSHLGNISGSPGGPAGGKAGGGEVLDYIQAQENRTLWRDEERSGSFPALFQALLLGFTRVSTVKACAGALSAI